MNTSQLPYFVAIAHTGTLSEAAKRLHVSQPTLSDYLANLEREIGMPLFFKSKKRYYPTPAGTLYLQTAEEILQNLERTKNAIRQLGLSPTRDLHIGLSPHRGVRFLSNAYADFNTRFPGTRLVPHEGYAMDLRKMLEDGLVSFAITSALQEERRIFRAIPFCREEVVLALPSFHSLAHNGARTLSALPYISLGECRDSVFIMPEKNSALHPAVHAIFRRIGFVPQVAITTPNVTMAISMIRNGNGVGLIPSYYVSDDKNICFYRLQQTSHMDSCLLVRRDHVLSEEEEYLCYLLIRDTLKQKNSPVTWTEETKQMYERFDAEYTNELIRMKS